MPLIVLDPYEQKRLIARRRRLGHDRTTRSGTEFT